MTFNFQLRTTKLIRNLRYLGSWFHVKSIKFDLYFLYALFINIYYNFHNYAQVMFIVKNYDDMNEWAASGLITLTELLTNLKSYCVIRNKERILRINSAVTQYSFQPGNEHQEKVVKDTFRLFDIMYRLHLMGPTLTVVFFTLYSFAEVRTSNRRKLPFKAWYPYDYWISPWFELTFFHQLTNSFIQAYLHVHVDCLAVNFMAILIVQLEILADNLKNIPNKDGTKKGMRKIKCSTETELLDCIKHHKQILNCFEDAYGIVNILMFGQLVTSTISFCLTSLVMSQISPGSTHFLALFIYELALLTQLLLFCWWGNELTHKSQEIPQAAFESDWIQASREFKKNLGFFIFRTQKPLVLRAINFFSINLGSFLLIIKNSYSFYAVLRHVNTVDV